MKTRELRALPVGTGEVILRTGLRSGVAMMVAGGLGALAAAGLSIQKTGAPQGFNFFLAVLAAGAVVSEVLRVACRGARLRSAEGATTPPPYVQRGKLDAKDHINSLVWTVAVVIGFLAAVAVFYGLDYNRAEYTVAGLAGLAAIFFGTRPLLRLLNATRESHGERANTLITTWNVMGLDNVRPAPQKTPVQNAVLGLSGLLFGAGLLAVATVGMLFGVRSHGRRVEPTVDPHSSLGEKLQAGADAAGVGMAIAVAGFALFGLLHVLALVRQTSRALSAQGTADDAANVFETGHWLRWCGQAVLVAGLGTMGLLQTFGRPETPWSALLVIAGIALIAVGEAREPHLFNRLLQAHPGKDFLPKPDSGT